MTPDQEQAIKEVREWSDEKAERVLRNLVLAAKHGIRVSIPNLLNEHDANDCRVALTALEYNMLESFKKEDEIDDSDIDEGMSSEPEENITADDKFALSEFADKLKELVESMPVTATKDEATQEEVPVLQSEASAQEVSLSQTPGEDTGKKSSEKTSKSKAGSK